MAKDKETVPAVELVVIEPFFDYPKGQIISDPAKVQELLDSEWAHNFVKKQREQPAA